MKKLFLLAAICIATINAMSQSFQHGAGLGVYIQDMDYSNVLVGSTITYNPRINFAETEKMSVSVGVPLTFGYAENYNYSYYYNDDNIIDDYYSFMMDAPVMVNLNLWGGSSKLSKQHVGGFIGAGYGYHYVTSREYAVYDESGNPAILKTGGGSAGPSFNGGVRIAIGRRRTKSIEIRFSYYKGTNRNKIDSYGIGAAFNF